MEGVSHKEEMRYYCSALFKLFLIRCVLTVRHNICDVVSEHIVIQLSVGVLANLISNTHVLSCGDQVDTVQGKDWLLACRMPM